MKIIIFFLFSVLSLSSSFNEPSDKFVDGDVKLVDGGSKKEGTVLIFRGYGWGSICDDHWTINEANVVCKQLLMEKAIKFYRRNHFQSFGIKSYFMDEVYCFGNESKISDCKFNGWGKHDCRNNEQVGVLCYGFPGLKTKPKGDPLNIKLPHNTLLNMRLTRFSIILEDEKEYSMSTVVTEVNGTKYPLCPLNFKAPENNVLCRQLYGKFGGTIKMVPFDISKYKNLKYLSRVGRCYGNESQIFDCTSYTDKNGIPCDSDKMLQINCTSELPDIRADYFETEKSSYLERLNLWHLQCALTEKCLPESLFNVIDRNPNSYFWLTRNLLRFSSIIENIGNSSFMPLEPPEKWEWHGCHLHYHSMKVFAVYEIIDKNKNIIASGHKASFCLEDNLCAPDSTPYFKCGNTVYNKGTQGISPGCKDTYLHEYDCQWVDITDIVPGTYTFQMIINPQFSVAESNFFNNGLSCTLYYLGYNAILRSCSWNHPYDLQ